MSATDPVAGGDLGALVEEADAEARRRDAERNVPDYWLVGFAAALRLLAAAPASEAATEGGHHDPEVCPLCGPHPALRDNVGADVIEPHDAATSREQGAAEAATEGANASPAEVVALRDYHWRVGAMLARLSEQAGVRPPGNPTVDALDDVEAALSARLAATPRADGEAAADLLAPAHDIACVINDHFNRRGADPNGMDGDDAIALLDAAQAAIRAHRCAPPTPEVVSDGDLVVEFIGSENDRWHRWAVRSSEQAAAEVVRTLLPRVHAVRVHRGTCGGNEPKTERAS